MPTRYQPYQKPEEEVINPVLSALNSFHPMSADLTAAFREQSFKVKILKGTYLLKQGEISNYLYFMISGIVAGYRINGYNKLTTFISVDGDFVSAIDGMYGNTPVEDNMVAESDCYLLVLRTEHLLDFFELYPEMNIIMRKVVEAYYRIAHKRSVLMRMGNAREKYAYYQQNLTTNKNDIPLPLVASFLDVKTETLKSIIREQSRPGAKVTDTENMFRLQNMIIKEQLFLKKKLRLQDIARRLKITPHELSSLLNNQYCQSFADFINIYRVNYIKDKLRSGNELQQLTIEGLGTQAGFSSKSTFFSAFKKHTGMSPLEFIKKGI